jgi:hypothetical protein
MLRYRLRSVLDVALLLLRPSLSGRLAYDHLAVPVDMSQASIFARLHTGLKFGLPNASTGANSFR